ncbi:MAG: hypothetical protein V4582_09615 [Pseudomonadota bacterium]
MDDWCTQIIAMRELREPDVYPSHDRDLMQALAMLEGAHGDAADMADMAAPRSAGGQAPCRSWI